MLSKSFVALWFIGACLALTLWYAYSNKSRLLNWTFKMINKSDVRALVLGSNLIRRAIDCSVLLQAYWLNKKHDISYQTRPCCHTMSMAGVIKAYMGVPRKISESHWGTYFIWPFRWRGFLGGSRMSSNIVSLHLPKYKREEILSQSHRSDGQCKYVFKHVHLTVLYELNQT